MSKKDLSRLENQVEKDLEQLRHDRKKLNKTAGFENIAVENFDYVPIVQEVIKGDEDEAER